MRWTGLKSIVMVERERTVGDSTTLEKAYCLTTRAPDAQRLGEIVRRHFSIENELHWVLDMTFDEDHSRVRDRNSTMNLALLRKWALLLRALPPNATPPQPDVPNPGLGRGVKAARTLAGPESTEWVRLRSAASKQAADQLCSR
jgi:predicted transposase YbfD/YdcC